MVFATSSEPIIYVKEPTIREIVITEARKQDLSPPLLNVSIKIMICESGGDPLSVGDKGKSRGLWQIHKDYWPEITDEMAFDPIVSTEWAIGKIKEGKIWLWTCSKLVK